MSSRSAAGRFIGPPVIGASIPLMGQAQIPWLMIGDLLTSAILFARCLPIGAACTGSRAASLRCAMSSKARAACGCRYSVS